MGSRSRIDQLAANAHALPGSTHTAFQDIAYRKVTANLFRVSCSSLVSEGRVASDYEKPPPFRQCGDDVLGEPVHEVFLLGIAAHIVEWKDCNRRPDSLWASFQLRPGRWRFRDRYGKRDAISAYRPRNVLDLLFAHIF